MNFKEFIRKRIMNFLGLERLGENPNDARLTYISNDEAVKLDNIRANKIWYVGDGNELLNFYTERQSKGFADNPVYNRNKRNYFWSLSTQECDIKRVHSGIPNAIISTFTNVIGSPDIQEDTGRWEKIADINDFNNKLTQQARPLTLACGYGAWKVNVNDKVAKHPTIEYYDAENVEYIYKCGLLIGIIFKSYYKSKDNKNYVLLESRYKSNGNSYIEYSLFELKNNNEIEQANLDCLEELKEIPRQAQVIEGLDEILAVPSRYFYDVQNQKYGKSIYAGKLDLFDMLDEVLSQASQTNRVSTPVEYYDVDALERSSNGVIGMPNIYNRQFVKKSAIPDGDGNTNDAIVTTQPDLNFDKYGGLAKDILDYILTGVLSPATMGIDVAKKDNADAQREKEKITILNRDNIIANETRQVRQLVKLCIMLDEYMETSKITLQDYNINVKYKQFANPSFENELQILGQAWVQGEISTEKYVDLLWSDSLTDEEKAKEVAWLDENKQQENINQDEFLMDEEEDNVQPTSENVQPTGATEEAPVGIKE